MNSLAVNGVPLYVMMLFGTSNWYMISEINSTTLAAIMEVVSFALIYLVNLSTATKMCVSQPLAKPNSILRVMCVLCHGSMSHCQLA
jgi:hypothetical protein